MTKLMKLFLAVILLASCSKKNDESNLTILTDNGEVSYVVENASTIPELEKGLMFRESLAPNAGMIFDLSKVEKIAMWMKNTKIALDMIFIDKDGTISWIYENAEPESTNLIIPPFPAVSILELNAGDIKKHNIKTGDIVKHEFFNNVTSDEPKKEDSSAEEKSVEAAADETPAEKDMEAAADEAPAPAASAEDQPVAMTE